MAAAVAKTGPDSTVGLLPVYGIKGIPRAPSESESRVMFSPESIRELCVKIVAENEPDRFRQLCTVLHVMLDDNLLEEAQSKLFGPTSPSSPT